MKTDHNADTRNEEVFTEELGWYSYNALVQRVVELEAALEKVRHRNDGNE